MKLMLEVVRVIKKEDTRSVQSQQKGFFQKPAKEQLTDKGQLKVMQPTFSAS
jgi:hypothetical protein